MTERMRGILRSLVVWVLVCPGLAHAGDGVRYLRATNLLPIQIARSGTYKLKSDIVVTNSDSTAILILPEATDVTLDLNGFAIRGPAQCTGEGGSLSCASRGVGVGIRSSDLPSSTIRILNGTLRGLGGAGISGIGIWSVEDIRVVGNGSWGLDVYGTGAIDRIVAYGNYDGGIRVDGIRVSNSSAVANRGGGVSSSGPLVAYSHVADNGHHGLAANDSTLIVGNRVDDNGGVGILMDPDSRSVLIANVVEQNLGGGLICRNCVLENLAVDDPYVGGAVDGGVVRGSLIDGGETGLTVSQGVVIAESVVRGSGGIGIALISEGDTALGGSLLYGQGGAMGGSGSTIEVDGNVCNGVMSCP